MQIESIPDSNTNFSLVFLKDTGKYIKNLTPHCKKHGSMNKVSVFEKEVDVDKCELIRLFISSFETQS